jgi:hypothetical protein
VRNSMIYKPNDEGGQHVRAAAESITSPAGAEAHTIAKMQEWLTEQSLANNELNSENISQWVRTLAQTLRARHQ